jgi:hypothetical protein
VECDVQPLKVPEHSAAQLQQDVLTDAAGDPQEPDASERLEGDGDEHGGDDLEQRTRAAPGHDRR